jgi:hypothetical protein
MLPDVNHPGWARFVTGKRPVQSAKATINLLIQRNKMSYERDQSSANVKDLVQKAHAFFSKYESMFGPEIATIFR